MRICLPLLMTLSLGACAPSDLQAQLDRARLERDQARLETKQARLEADKAILEAERVRFAAERQLSDAANSSAADTPAPPPPPAETKTTVVRGQFKFLGGKGTAVSVHVAGMGIDESFHSNPKGQIAIELPVGHYQINLEAKGYRSKVLTVDIPALPASERFELRAKLQAQK